MLSFFSTDAGREPVRNGFNVANSEIAILHGIIKSANDTTKEFVFSSKTKDVWIKNKHLRTSKSEYYTSFLMFIQITQSSRLSLSEKKIFMNKIYSIFAAIVVLLIVAIIGCSRTAKQATDNEKEESGTELALDETYDKVRNGARLILNYDPQSNSFKGTVENTTNETLKQVRVEVHLSNEKELGPTTPVDLVPSEKKNVELPAGSTDFDGWTAHPEVGEGEHGHGEEHGEHDSEHEGEHEKKGEHD